MPDVWDIIHDYRRQYRLAVQRCRRLREQQRERGETIRRLQNKLSDLKSLSVGQQNRIAQLERAGDGGR